MSCALGIQVAGTFSLDLDDDTQKDLSDIARLDTCVTVVDAAQLKANFELLEMLRQRSSDAAAEDDRAVPNLVLEQIEFADVMLLNRVSCVLQSMRQCHAKPCKSVRRGNNFPGAHFYR